MRDLRPDLRIALSLAGIAAVTVPASAPVAIAAAAAAAAAPAASGWDELAGVTLGPEYLDSAVESLLNAAVSELAKRDELVENARQKITNDEARTVIIERLRKVLMNTYQAYLRADLRACIRAIENL
ncbi:MAG: hypothetical protein KJ717_01610 [Proteobacteria bacterium]|nr:hypothetical protein [Pseudomonadota bacterium]